MLIIDTPSGFDRFVAEVGFQTSITDRLPEPSQPDILRLIEIVGRFGIEFPAPPATIS